MDKVNTLLKKNCVLALIHHKFNWDGEVGDPSNLRLSGNLVISDVRNQEEPRFCEMDAASVVL